MGSKEERVMGGGASPEGGGEPILADFSALDISGEISDSEAVLERILNSKEPIFVVQDGTFKGLFFPARADDQAGLEAIAEGLNRDDPLRQTMLAEGFVEADRPDAAE